MIPTEDGKIYEAHAMLKDGTRISLNQFIGQKLAEIEPEFELIEYRKERYYHMPTVVRCKDCNFAEERDDGRFFCHRYRVVNGVNDFCSHGELRF